MGARDGQRPCGLRVTSFISVSLQPPLVALTVPHRGEGQLPAGSERFTVSILSQYQEPVANEYPEWKPMHPSHFQLLDGLPVVTGSLAWVVCAVHERQEVGDGTILIGRVEDVGLGEGRPLLRFADEHARLRELQLSD